MAVPVIVFNADTGDDLLSSGAGPGDGTTGGSALNGTNASTDGTGTVVTLDGSPDLTNVAVDGSHVLLMRNVATLRAFAAIVAKDNTAKTVTVAFSVGASASGISWAIGGKLATFNNATHSRKLWERNSGAGDAMPGWTMRTETDQTISSVIQPRRSGDTTDGPITTEGASYVSPRPVLLQTANANHFTMGAITQLRFRRLHFQNSNATKTNAIALNPTNSNAILNIEDCIFGHATNQLFKAVDSVGVQRLTDCLIHHCTDRGLQGVSATIWVIVRCAFISNLRGISGGQIHTLLDCIFADNTEHGVIQSAGAPGSVRVYGCVFHGNGGSGLHMGSSNNAEFSQIERNIFTSNGEYGIYFDVAAPVRNNIDWNAYGVGSLANTSGKVNNISVGPNSVEISADPFDNAAGRDFNLNNAVNGGAVLRDMDLPLVGAEDTSLHLFNALVVPSAGGSSLAFIRRGGLAARL